MHPFPTLLRAFFRNRPNRFRVNCQLEDGQEVAAFMPNPGRMWELLIPGAVLYLNPAPTDGKPRKTKWTVVGVERHGEAIFLHTHVTNAVAEYLIQQKRIPELGDAKIVRREVTVGRSRFDFLLEDATGQIYTEVKSCTLFGNGVAMFPDAITERGRRHLEELATLTEQGYRAAIIFIVHSNRVGCFMPDYHTDPAFSATLCTVRDRVQVLPVSIHWTQRLALDSNNTTLTIPWKWVERENQERGICIGVYTLLRKRRVALGGGSHTLAKGHYLVLQAVDENMTQHLNRLKRRPGKVQTVGDWFRKEADLIESLPIRTADEFFGEIDTHLQAMFASVDTIEETNTAVFRCEDVNPLNEDAFHLLVESFRMRSPERVL